MILNSYMGLEVFYKCDSPLSDPFRDLFPDNKRYTWRKNNPLQQARLDFFLLSPILQSCCSDTYVKPSFQSDHSIIIMKLKLNDNFRVFAR